MKTTRNLTSKDLKSKNQSVIYENGKPIYRTGEILGTMTSNDLEYYLRNSQDYFKY
jgi:hypothetical protein